jgi:cytochrome d ubiquinol oxidase subunit I
MEGLWRTEASAPLTLFGIPDEARRTTHLALEIPYAASLILTQSTTGEVQGLEEFRGMHPPVAPVFWAFRVMVGVGVLMIAVSWWALASMLKRGMPSPAVLRALSWMTFSGWVGTLAGWYVTEIGRQPWLIRGVMLVEEAVAPHAPPTVATSVAAYFLLYAFLLTAFVGTLRYLSTKPAASLKLGNPPAVGAREPQDRA